jgi:type 1 glutamine amidotransferase
MRAIFTRIAWILALVLLAFAARAEQFRVLVFTKNSGWHHESINAAVTAFKELGQLHDFGVFWTEDAHRVMNDTELAKYKVVVFLLTTGDILDDEQKAAFQRYVRRGGGFVGIHSAADTEHHWDWYAKLVGRMFHIHPAIQTATVVVNDRNFPGMERFAKRFLFTEEWYEFEPPAVEGLTTLLSVDERTYRPQAEGGGKKGFGMGADHPVSWYHPFDGGRAFYTALGHLPATYSDAAFMHHVYGGIYWAATGNTFHAE